MKRSLRSLVLAGAMLALMVPATFAAQGGAPAAHGVDGRTFGSLVSMTAQSAPGAIAAHVSSR